MERAGFTFGVAIVGQAVDWASGENPKVGVSTEQLLIRVKRRILEALGHVDRGLFSV